MFKKPQHHRHAGLFGYPGLPTAFSASPGPGAGWINPLLQAVETAWLPRQRLHALGIVERRDESVLHRPAAPIAPALAAADPCSDILCFGGDAATARGT
ncbi:MAG: hypothetical protein M5R40_07465 [Anaerolineae bacterium]|nr:hypothetical protein [Anaerolineae bacterium]